MASLLTAGQGKPPLNRRQSSLFFKSCISKELETQETLGSSFHYSPLDGIQVHDRDVSTWSRCIYSACVQVKWLYCLLAKKNLSKQDGVVYRIPCDCDKVYIGETGRPMQDRIKEHDREIRLAHIQTSVVSEHDHNTGHQPRWNEVKFIDRDPHYYTRRVIKAIHIIRLHSDDISRDSGIEIPEAWMPTIRKKHNNRRAVRQWTAEGTNQRNSEDRNVPITTGESHPITAEHNTL